MIKRSIKRGHSWWYRVASKRHRRLAVICSGLLLLVVVVQLLYPSDRALPFSRVGGDAVGFATADDVSKKLLGDYGKGVVKTSVNGKNTSTPLTQTGLKIDTETVANGVSDYPWYMRLVPFSVFVKGALTDQPVSMQVDVQNFAFFAAEQSKVCRIEPKNAGVTVHEGTVILDPARDGADCPKADLQKQLTAEPLSKAGITRQIKTIPVKPVRSDGDVAGLLKEANVVAARKLTVTVANKTYAIDQPTLAGWLAFPEDPATKKLTVGINNEAVTTYLASIQKDVYIAPGTTTITTVDGIETGRVSGSSGRGVDLEKTAEAIKTQVLAGDGLVSATLTSLPPKIAYNRSYSKTPEGLQALVNDIVKDKGDFAVSVRKLGDSGVSANGSKSYHPASTYKLVVGYSVLKRIDGGQMSWGQSSTGGQTVSQCLDNMIVNSDNACAEWFGATIGWGTITSEARALGMSNTTLSRPFVSTANDMALFLQKLESNQLGISEPSRARLLDAMKRQVYRRGIPAGVGVPVADKVGFLDGLLHDAAIVYAPSGVYVMVIYSNGSSWAAIADAAAKIHAQIQ